MREPESRFVDGRPRLHFLRWSSTAIGPAGQACLPRPRRRQAPGERTLVLLHGNSANAWWWQPLAGEMAAQFSLLALDQRGHGDSEWVRPPDYQPRAYADDLDRFIAANALEKPIIVGHSMGGIVALAFAERHPEAIRAAVAIDVAITSGRGRDRYLRRLRALPVVTYRDLETAIGRFRLMPKEGDIRPEVLAAIARRSFAPAAARGYTLKFDREGFSGSDGLDVAGAIARVRVPLLLIRAEHSRIMTAEAAARAAASNPAAQLTVIPGVHHHLLLERPDLLARAIAQFAASLC